MNTELTIAAIILMHTEDRWADIVQAVESVQRQTRSPDEIVLLVDHNRPLFDRAIAAFGSFATVVENDEMRGESGARNASARATKADVLAYLDDDATAEPAWIESLLAWYDDPSVLGVGGTAIPAWDTGQPAWFPAEFNWVVGCSHSGIPDHPSRVRNVIGCNMSFRRSVWEAVGGFYDGLGRVGSNAFGCSETEFCIRSSSELGGSFVNEPRARIRHRVPAARTSPKYFLTRCRSEGLSKAHLAQRAGSDSALSAERQYVRRTLPLGFAAGLRDAVRLDPAGLARSGAIVVGTAVTGFGYIEGVVRQRRSTDAATAHDFRPAETLSIDLTQPLPPLDPSYRRVVALLRVGADPVSVIEVDGPMSPAELADNIWASESSAIKTALARQGRSTATQLFARGLVADSGAGSESVASQPTARAGVAAEDAGTRAGSDPTTAVVIATRDRSESLIRCLESLTGLRQLPDQIVVVDNAPTTAGTREAVESWNAAGRPRVDYVFEPIAGLATAHNTGLDAVRTDLVAFTDDDVLVDVAWLDELVAGFAAAPGVTCVTGMIFPAELETWPQQWMESHAGFSKGFERQIFDLAENRPDDPLFPFTAGSMGSGANMAFDAGALRARGAFNDALGAGTIALGGDDLHAFHAVVTNGETLVYQPSAVVFHHHHRDQTAIENLAYGYGAGLGAYLASVVAENPRSVVGMIGRAPRALRHARATTAPPLTTDLPGHRMMAWRQRRGTLAGPLRYGRSRWQKRRR